MLIAVPILNMSKQRFAAVANYINIWVRLVQQDPTLGAAPINVRVNDIPRSFLTSLAHQHTGEVVDLWKIW